MIADMVVLCHAMQKFDQNYRTRTEVIGHKRAKCDLDIPSYKEIIAKYKNNDF
jgi:hypothetical protein